MTTHYLYAISTRHKMFGDCVKFGVTGNPQQRLKAYAKPKQAKIEKFVIGPFERAHAYEMEKHIKWFFNRGQEWVRGKSFVKVRRAVARAEKDLSDYKENLAKKDQLLVDAMACGNFSYLYENVHCLKTFLQENSHITGKK